MTRFLDSLDRQPAGVVIGVALLTLAFGVWADLATAADVSVSILYVLPVILLAWSVGRGWAVAFSLIAAVSWLGVFLLQHPASVRTYVPYWNAGGELAFYALIGHLIHALRLERNEKAALATLDPLTGALNRRGFLERLGLERQRALRTQAPLSVAYLDIDAFKALNDRAGHAAGDALLRDFVAVLQARIRATDTLGRMGGDEFAILLPDTDRPQAERLLAELQAQIQAAMDAGGTGTSVSVGAITASGELPEAEALLAAADAEMYCAKAFGKHRSRSGERPV